MIKRILSIPLVLFLSFFLFGNIYFWTDENGIKHYTNTSPPTHGNVQQIEETQKILKKLAHPKYQNHRFKVLKIYDGDTIQVKGLDLVFKIRLVGIDAPEIGYRGQKSQAFSRKSKQYLSALLNHQHVRLKSYGTGGYNRQLAEVFINNSNINIMMIQAGLAEVYKGRRPKTLDADVYLQEEQAARAAKKGIWSQGRSYKSPRQWRKEHPRK